MNQTEELMFVDPNDIEVGYRHRKDMGDLTKLATSIDELGLLQPIGITSSMKLVYGERRLRAVRDILKHDEIACRVINLDKLENVKAEHDENELHKRFTGTERVAIAREIENMTPSRQGTNQHTKEDRRNCTQAGKTEAIAAKAAGFKSRDEYRRTAKVVDDGVPELADMMDAGEVAVSAAAEVAKLPQEEQKEVVKSGPQAVKEKAKQQRAKRIETAKTLPKLGPPCRGLQMARIAIMKLEEIEPDDIERNHAIELVRKWVKDNE